MEDKHLKQRDTSDNSLVKLLELFPNKPWDPNGILENPNISWEYIQNNYKTNSNKY